MGSMGLERTYAVIVGTVFVVLGLAGSLGTPIVGRPDETGIVVTGFGHDLVHLVVGALFVHAGIALNGRNRAYAIIGLGIALLATGVLSLVSGDLFGLYGASASGFDQLAHILLGAISIIVGWLGRDEEKREFGRAVSRPIRE
jgi:hypothetical protein